MKRRTFGIERVLRIERNACGVRDTDQLSRDKLEFPIRKVLVLVHRKADAKAEHQGARRADEARGQGTILHEFSSRNVTTSPVGVPETRDRGVAHAPAS